jgi:hypothetical protein
MKSIKMWIGTYRTLSHGLECQCHGLAGPAAGIFKFSVYIYQLESHVFKLCEQIGLLVLGASDTRKKKVRGSNPMAVKVIFFTGHDKQMNFFLLLPNDTRAPCLRAAHSGPSLTLTKALSFSTNTWTSGTEWWKVQHCEIRICMISES